MVKVVYNNQHGGFSLSDAGMRRYAELKGLTLYPEPGRFGLVTYWIVPESERDGIAEDDAWHALDSKGRGESNRRHDECTISCRDFIRTDPILVQVVEELGEAANGQCASLAIAEVASGARYRIDEYDGAESVMTPEDYNWTVAP